ncbi:hypothetical protein [Halomonas sp. 707B3]|uniref:hypothetical protein n=1 Tax=Halomonas sp. 707B3 TaxID=1681043 RepID=UPI00209E3893|nr:hypothetical protein [Halomonas sp. 707B3]MCP1316852.1 hypothetical protein [Halomonas sp. 707B3]
MGGSSPSKPEMTLSEKAQHAVAAAEWDHYKQNYAPLENRYLSDSRKDYEGRTQAQSASQVMREGTEAMRLSALGGGVSKVGGTVADALTMSNVESASSAQQLRDNRMTGALGIGRDIATGTTSSMASLARTGAQGSINNMRNKLTVDMAKDRGSTARGPSCRSGCGRYERRWRRHTHGKQQPLHQRSATAH